MEIRSTPFDDDYYEWFESDHDTADLEDVRAVTAGCEREIRSTSFDINDLEWLDTDHDSRVGRCKGSTGRGEGNQERHPSASLEVLGRKAGQYEAHHFVTTTRSDLTPTMTWLPNWKM